MAPYCALSTPFSPRPISTSAFGSWRFCEWRSGVQAQYVWNQHAAIAKAIGIGESQIDALEHGQLPAELFFSRERALLAFVDEALDLPRVTNETFTRAQAEFTARELVELLLTIGYFRMIGRLLTTLDIELDEPRGVELLQLPEKAA